MHWALGGEGLRDRLTGLYRLEAGLLGVETHGTWLAEDDGRVLAAACWVRPDAAPSPATAQLVADQVQALLGDRAPVLAAAEEASTALHPPGEHWFLACVGTRPAARGRGLATAVLRAGLQAVDAAGASALLETSAAGNVRRYERLGFAVVGEVDPPGGAPHTWVMHRPVQR
ncbi:GNAT family N-acetyltransferase [Modestobacter sp. SYSU DS0290]